MVRRSRKPSTLEQRRDLPERDTPEAPQEGRSRWVSRGDEFVLELLALLRRLELRRFKLGGAGWLLGLFLVHSTLSDSSPSPDGVARLVRSVENLPGHIGDRQ